MAVQVQTVNKHAANRYVQFEQAMESVRIALAASDRLIRGMKESPQRFAGWQVPEKQEVIAARDRAQALLEGLRKKAKEYETELLSRGWRV